MNLDIRLRVSFLAMMILFLLCGCGERIGKPEETPPPRFCDSCYVLVYKRTDFPGTTDIVVTIGGYAYVAQESSRVTAYTTLLSWKHPLIRDLTGLVKPVLLAEGVNEEMYIADAGDMTVKRFPRSGGAPRHRQLGYNGGDWSPDGSSCQGQVGLRRRPRV